MRIDPYCTGPLGTWERGSCEEPPTLCEVHRECVSCTDPALFCAVHANTKCSEDKCKEPVFDSKCKAHFLQSLEVQCEDIEHVRKGKQVQASYMMCEEHFLASAMAIATSYKEMVKPLPPAVKGYAVGGNTSGSRKPMLALPSGYASTYQDYEDSLLVYGQQSVQQQPPATPLCSNKGHTEASYSYCEDCLEIEVQKRVIKVLEGYGIAV